MKMLLIHAWNEKERSYRGKFSELLSYPSLTLAAIRPLIPDRAFERIDIADEKCCRINYNKERYDLVMISADTSSAMTAYKHCAEFRKRGAYTVMGGYHATALPDEALKYCDTVIIGPAEKSVPRFTKDFIRGCPEKKYRDYNVCPAEFPVPARDIIARRHTLAVPALIADRGCDNRCKYCSMSAMWRSDPRPVESVISELKALRSKMVIFYDPNFFAKKDYALKLMKAMEPLNIVWASNAAADFGTDQELMEAAYRSGCRGVLIGLESTSSVSLRNAAKRFNDADRYKEIIANIHSHGIAVNGCFVLGFDTDTEEELLSLPRRVDELELDLCRFAILTPYPGTRFYTEFDRTGRIITKDWSRYTQHEAVFRPANMSPERLNVIFRQVWREAYTGERVIKRVARSPMGRSPYMPVLLGANIGFKYLGIRDI